MEVFYIVSIFILGLCIGSFVNVCIYRLPREQSIIIPPSHCTSCNTRILKRDLIPVISYIILGGKCRNCKTHISMKYPLIEVLVGVLFLLIYLKVGFALEFLFYSALVSIFVIIFFIDLEHMIIPDGLNLIIGILGITFNIVYANGDYKGALLNMLFGFLLGGGFFFILGLFGAMGGGDIKMMAALGLLFGWKTAILLMFLSFAFGSIISLGLLAAKVKTMKDMIPFGPYIALASIVTIFVGQEILSWYTGMLVI